MIFDPTKLRFEIQKDGNAHWHGTGRVTYVGTGHVVEFEASWRDYGAHGRAVKKLRDLIEALPED